MDDYRASFKSAGDMLVIKYVPLSRITAWGRNKKLHDIDGIIASMAEAFR